MTGKSPHLPTHTTNHDVLTFAATPNAAPIVRARLREVLTGRVPDVGDALQMVAELFSNTVLHTYSGLGGAVDIKVADLADRVRVAVTDDGPLNGNQPAIRDRPDENGRGLRIVAELALAWGWGRCDDKPGTAVWFEVPRKTS